MMKGMLKRALGVVAAAAMAVTGMAALTGTANAATSNGNESITIHNSQAGSTYTAYQLASFEEITADGSGNITSVAVKTAVNPNTANAIKDAIPAEKLPIPAYYAENPAAYVATFDASSLRNFANNFDTTNVPAAGTANGENAVIGSLSAGWYLVTDTDTNSRDQQTGKPMIVASTNGDYQTITLNDVSRQPLGEVVAKSNTPTKPGKTADEANQALGVNSSVNYTITSTVPNFAGATSDETYYYINDKPSVGLTVEVNTDNIKAYVSDNSGTVSVSDGKAMISGQEVYLGFPDGRYTLIDLEDCLRVYENNSLSGNTVIKGNAAQTNYFSINLSQWAQTNQQFAGKSLYVRYTATINSEVQSNSTVTNTAAVSNDPNDPWASGETNTPVKVGNIQFHKVGTKNGDGSGLNKAKFVVYLSNESGVVDENEKPLAFQALANQQGGYVYTGSSASSKEDNSAKVESQTVGDVIGSVKLYGLKTGYYVIDETDVPENYAQNLAAKFLVQVDANGNYHFVKNLITFASDPAMTRGNTYEKGGVITVVNAVKASQLPATGASGIAMFVVVAVLVAGAAVAVYGRSRKAATALRA